MTKRIIQLAKETALSGFAGLVRSMVSDADQRIAQAVTSQQSSFDRTAIATARDFLRREGSAFTMRMETFHRDYLERAMRTMYTDLRAELHTLSAEHLSLIDDETMNRQIEVDRLMQRLRDAERENLGRLNIMIAQLHGEHDVRERENPFRPYLLARTLHETLNDMVKDVAGREVLFEYLGQAMIAGLPAYYKSICDVFESGGVRAQLIARPSMLSPAQREMLARQALHAWQGMPVFPSIPGGISLGIQTAAPASQTAEQGFPDLVRRLFNRPKWTGKVRQENATESEAAERSPDHQADAIPFTAEKPPESGQAQKSADSSPGASSPHVSISEDLISRLTRLQQEEQAATASGEPQAQEENRLFSLREQLEAEHIGSQERVIIEVMALLFEFILRDKLLPAPLREKIIRLQIPLLKAAMLEPEMLQQPGHPARQLLDRMGSLAAGVDADSPEIKEVGEEIARVSDRILSGFAQDVTIFSDCLSELDRFAAQRLTDTDLQSAGLQEAIDEAESLSVLMTNLSKSLERMIQPLKPDARVVEFILQTWSRVVAYAALAEIRKEGMQLPSFRVPQLDLIPGLVWSAQPRQTAQERSALMRFLPGLVGAMKKNLQSIPLSEAEYQQALDQLVSVHTEVLRPSGQSPVISQPLPGLDELTSQFSSMTIDSSLAASGESMSVERGIVAAALAQRKINAELVVERDTAPLLASDRDALAKLKPGTLVDCALRNHTGQARVIATGALGGIYVFQLRDQDVPVMVYSSNTLAKALRNGSLKLLESVPLFERAVESLMTEVESP